MATRVLTSIVGSLGSALRPVAGHRPARGAIAAEIRRYLWVGGALLVLTVVTVAASYLHAMVPIAVSIAVAVTIALLKGSLVVSVFMHLVEERKPIFMILTLAVFLLVMLMLMPVLGRASRVGHDYSLPYTQAEPTVAPAAH